MLEVIAFALIAALTGGVIRKIHARQSQLRAAEFQQGENPAISCRVSWQGGLGRRAFLYGKLNSNAGGAFFTRPARQPVRLPVDGRATRCASWRSGMEVLEYETRQGDQLRILAHEGDVDLVVRYLRGG